jgi:excisionase family DNA binding protein
LSTVQKVNEPQNAAIIQAGGYQEQPLLGKPELAKYLGVSVGKVTAMVIDGTGPRYYRVGLFVRFKMEDVHQWLETRAVDPRKKTGT